MKRLVALIVALCFVSMSLGIVLTLILVTPFLPPRTYGTQAIAVLQTVLPPSAPTEPQPTATTNIWLLPTVTAIPGAAAAAYTIPTAVTAPMPSQTTIDQPPPPIAPSGSALPYEQICNPNFTDLQETEMVAAMTGKQVIGWRGRVWDVSSDGDLYKIDVIMGQNPLSAPDTIIRGVSRDIAIQLSANQYITFSGTISRIEIFLNICSPLEIIGATISR